MEFPSGDPDFKSIRENNFYYVDKTKYLKTLIKKGKYYFLSRPRRFGKSLLVSTLESLFDGEKELFKGLHIYDNWDWNKKHPVIRISFDGACRTPELIKKNITLDLNEVAKKYDLNPSQYKGLEPFEYLHTLFYDCRKKAADQTVVLLIDEYDKPILDVLHDKKEAEINKEYLRGFYSVIKGCTKHIRFVFVTGITMFSKTNMFSGLNNLVNMSLEEECNAICGFTESELSTVFKKELKSFNLEKIRHFYNGYSWTGDPSDPRVYNPTSILNMMRLNRFNVWWFETGTPTYLFNYMVKNRVLVSDLDNEKSNSNVLSSFNITKVNMKALLFQSGYLTLSNKTGVDHNVTYQLNFPNLEVRTSLYRELIQHIIDFEMDASEGKYLLKLLSQNNFDKFAETLKAYLAQIPYFIQPPEKISLEEREYIYALILHGQLWGLHGDLQAEKLSCRGRCDMVLSYDDQIFIFELKVIFDESKQKETLDAAMNQIHAQGYEDPYQSKGKPIHLIALVFGKTKRNLLAIRHETL